MLRLIGSNRLFCFVFRYSLTDEGCGLAEKLETVTGDSLSPVSRCSTVDLTSERNFTLATTEVARNPKLVQHVCIDLKEPQGICKESAGYYNFTSVRKRKEEEMKPR